MSVELLIIRCGERYLRTSNERFELVGLDKASVFPLAQLGRVKDLERKACQQGFSAPSIKKLVLTEEELA
ncbi:MAG: hypothetical protein ACK5PS_13485 [Desulfopila sp.]